ncbi:carbohydrate kinase [uncultured Algibacter sp.]|uniref:carbohydrate kinase family protein n=1 Tax=uncultured Algibacter sp. TaxID=298659 RepID=UPI0026217A93|nr:carbohydrate kinase [uncultured Algibacter sp.]
MSKIVCFGEVLWDVFPTYKKIGGAPLNVALRLQSLENEVSMISSIGHDDLGKEVLKYLEAHHVAVEAVQEAPNLPTGKVNVTLDDNGVASYEIAYPCAWDAIQLDDASINIVKQSDAFVFGSLVARDARSKNALYALLEHANYKIFDLNLRPPHYSKDTLLHLMNQADFIKFNDEELVEVCTYLGDEKKSIEEHLLFISKKTNTKHVCVTKGAHGAVLFYEGFFYANSGYPVKVVDTVGAGDSFLASLVSQLLHRNYPQDAINFACAVGAIVAQSEGANPKISNAEIDRFINQY